MSARRFEGKTAIVLGASAEGGSGWAIAERLAAEGAKVVVASRNLAALEKLAAKIGGVAVKADAAEPADLVRLADIAHETFGPIDVAIDAAGWPMPGFIADITPENARRAMDVNFFGPLFFVQNCARVMKDGGAMAIISSISSTHVAEGQVAYSCAKAATNLMVRYAAVEFGPRDIRINIVTPAFIESAMTAPMRTVPGVVETILKEVPLNRAAKPEDLAAACLWLCTPESFITGAIIPVDGGNHLRRCVVAADFPPGVYEKIGA